MKARAPLVLVATLLVASWALPVTRLEDTSTYASTLAAAERHLDGGNHAKARELVERVLERDAKAVPAWDLRARWADAVGDRDEAIYARHRALRLAEAQDAGEAELQERRASLLELDPVAGELFALREDYLARLLPIAARYEADGRPHAAIRVLKQVLALDPESAAAQEAIERVASAPDPSLAEHASPKDLFEDVSEEWIREHDADHDTWETRASLERENYTTHTDAGYEVLVRAAEAMEQMNGFYRQFFRYGTEEDGKSVPKIGLNIFKSREEYLERGIGPPVEWSAGHFTGDYVECYIGAGGFEEMTGTLFHEAAHQFVSLATSAVGWLNEGLASFFEGTRILPNGTVLMNMPASHRLFPLAERMERGWMESADDGLDEGDPNATPRTAPTFRIVLENEYAWGPPWYAPTWGVVYFLYNYQDPVDGRFIYRDAFAEFLNKSGGRSGNGAVENFEEVVLAHPARPLRGVEGERAVSLPRSVEELDPVWRDWCLALRDELAGNLEVERPYLDWGRYAAANGMPLVAKEHFEKGLAATPEDPRLCEAFAELLAEELGDSDRAAQLVLDALRLRETQEEPDPARIRELERWLGTLDKRHAKVLRVRDDLASDARAVVARYQAEGLHLMVMDTSWRLGANLDLVGLFEDYEAAVRASGKSLAIWSLAYNERDLEGWNLQGGEGAFRPAGTVLEASFGEYDPDVHDYQFLTLDQVTSGDFSMEVKLQAERGEVDFAGLVFGQKSSTSFHGLFYVPGRAEARAGTANPDYVDLMSSFGEPTPKIWHHVPIPEEREATGTSAGTWRTLRVDVSGALVDFWLDGELCGTHEFASREVLRGKFGLVTGRGHARFRDVRYLARDGRDIASSLERELRLERFAGGATEGGPVGTSYQGFVPPWPRVERWVQGGRSSWAEAGPVPQLLVLFSIRQNELVPIDGWLRALDARFGDLGLRIVCLAEPGDLEALPRYLEEHALPGDVAVDYREPGVAGIGSSFETFFIDRFNLPRVLLLDVDQRVVWEGDPGVILGEGLTPPFETYVDDPLEELLAKRRLAEHAAWSEAWVERGLPALARGDLAAAAELLEEASALDGEVHPAVAAAQRRRAAVLADLADLDRVARELHEDQADPALAVLLEWGEALGQPVDPKALRAHKRVLEGKLAKAWRSALKATTRYVEKTRLPREERVEKLLARLADLEGLFVRELEADLEASRDDEARFGELAAGAATRPALWLARRRYGW